MFNPINNRTRWTWVWVSSGSWCWTGRPGVLQSLGSQRVGHNWATELNWYFNLRIKVVCRWDLQYFWQSRVDFFRVSLLWKWYFYLRTCVLSLKNCNIIWMSVRPSVPLGNKKWRLGQMEDGCGSAARSRQGSLELALFLGISARLPALCRGWPSVGVYFTRPVCAFLGNPRKGGSYQSEREFLIFSKKAVRLHWWRDLVEWQEEIESSWEHDIIGCFCRIRGEWKLNKAWI